MIIAGMGALHLEILVERLGSEYGVNVESRQPKVSYRENITKELKDVEVWYKKKPGDFKKAAKLALQGDGTEERKKRIQELGIVLLEPIMQLEVVVPLEYVGDVVADLNRRRTEIESQEQEEKEGNIHIKGKTPLK